MKQNVTIEEDWAAVVAKAKEAFGPESYRCCWSCGERKDLAIRQLVTHPKYHYTCKACNEYWVKVHCSQNGDHLVKHTLNYHLQVRRNQRWFVVCPTCRDGANLIY